MKPKGVILTGPDKTIAAQAEARGLPVQVDPEMPLAYSKTLFVAPGTGVPWDLLPAAWHFLERWDAAVPLWRYGRTANDVGSKEERKRTAAVIRDLRVLLHSVELLFVRNNEQGQALMEAYRAELGDHGGAPLPDARLAFLRALYTVKPCLCVLPTTWLAEIQARAKQDARVLSARGRTMPRGPLVQVEIAPGQFVKCHPGEEERVLRLLTPKRRRER